MEQQPKTLDECIKYLSNLKLNPTDIDGRQIRNKWGLWSGSELANWFYDRKIYHADDMSGIIIDSYQRYMDNAPIDIEGQIEVYHKHWEKLYGKGHLTIMFRHIEKFYKSEIRDKKIEKIISN